MNNKSLVVLVAGKGTRFIPLTNTVPKPLLKIAGKTPFEHNFEEIIENFNQIILVVGYLKESFKEYFGDEYKGVSITYVEQAETRGTGHAVNMVKDIVTNDSFLLAYGDDLYDPELLKKLLEKDHAAIGKKEKNWQNFGVFKLKDDNLLDEIIEKPQGFVGDLVNIGVYMLNKQIFDYFDKIKESVRGELEFTDMISLYAQDVPFEIIETQSGWMPLSYPWDLLEATRVKLEQLPSTNDANKGLIEENVTIKGNVIMSEGSVIKSGAYLEGNFLIGKNCVIGPNCFLKNWAAIGDNCQIGNAVEINRSIIGNNTKIRHLAYIGDSILGNNVNIAAGTILANNRHDNQNIKMNINENIVDSGRRKLGAIIGDNAKTGVNTSIYPGIKIFNEATTLPGEVISKDKK